LFFIQGPAGSSEGADQQDRSAGFMSCEMTEPQLEMGEFGYHDDRHGVPLPRFGGASGVAQLTRTPVLLAFFARTAKPRRAAIAVALAGSLSFGAPAWCAEALAPAKSFASASDVAALVAKAARERKLGEPTVLEPLVSLPPYQANVEYRTAVGPAAVHEKAGELFYVIQGTGAFTLGGVLVEAARRDAGNLTGKSVAGGAVRAVGPGDVIFVPQNTPHWFNRIDGVLILMAMLTPLAAP
jgi:mannose-6-phosphate isomerase-like protein (cupin superfamily)